MHVYDFDNTIYDGESIFDFFLFCLRKKPSLLQYLPLMLRKLIQYKRCRLSTEDLTRSAENVAYQMLCRLGDVDRYVKEFWDRNEKKIKPFYHVQHRADDWIITASPSFFMDEILTRLGIQNRICSEVEVSTGKIEFLCYRENKVEIFSKCCPEGKIDAFYTDSMNDLPMIELAEQAFLVRGEKIERIKP